jgi:nucleotide-binding universal stress UspA family protein
MSNSTFKILVPIDFSEASQKAVEQASLLNGDLKVNIELLHVINEDEHSKVDFMLEEIAESLSEKGIIAAPVTIKGSILSTINNYAHEAGFDLVVIGTHGARGIRQNLFGADILKLLKDSHCPSLVVQKASKPVEQFKKILFPVGSHKDFLSLAKIVAQIAKASNARVIIYTISRPYEETSESLNINKQNTKQFLFDQGIMVSEVIEPSSVYSFGFAKQTIQYAENNDIDLIAIMAHSSNEHTYFADADKERMLTNEKGIAILCASGH